MVRVGCEFVQHTHRPPHAVLQVEPRPDGDFRLVRAAWDDETAATSRTYLDAGGNLCRRLTLPTGRSVLRFDETVELLDVAVVSTFGTADLEAMEVWAEEVG